MIKVLHIFRICNNRCPFGLADLFKECAALESGLIAIDVDKPVNLSGGRIGFVYPVGASVIWMFLT